MCNLVVVSTKGQILLGNLGRLSGNLCWWIMSMKLCN